jgi:hypothetical protein
MKTILIVGSTVVTLALIFYSIAIISEQRKKMVTNFILTFLIIGVVSDIAATIMMIIGSSTKGISYHGLLGYSALAVMLIDAILLLRFKAKEGNGAVVPKGLHLYSRYAYSWWIIAYITGTILVMMR